MIEFQNSYGKIGASYSERMHPLIKKHRHPMVMISLYFIDVMIYMPWNHSTEKGHGSAFRSWGITLMKGRLLLKWGFNHKFIG